MGIYTDLDYERGSDGVYDIAVDEESGDFALIDGIDAALMVSFFSDRRAREDEVNDPYKRRGWIGDLVSDVPDDRHGSGLWLYEQRRLTQETVIGLRIEAEAALQWMIDEGIVRTVQADVRSDPAKRAVYLVIICGMPDGSVDRKAYALVEKTIRRNIASNHGSTRPVSTSGSRTDVIEWGGIPVDWDLGSKITWE